MKYLYSINGFFSCIPFPRHLLLVVPLHILPSLWVWAWLRNQRWCRWPGTPLSLYQELGSFYQDYLEFLVLGHNLLESSQHILESSDHIEKLCAGSGTSLLSSQPVDSQYHLPAIWVSLLGLPAQSSEDSSLI